MKGFVLLFLAVVFFGIGWRYTPKAIRRDIRTAVTSNLWVVLLAVLLVAAAIFFSINSTVRLV